MWRKSTAAVLFFVFLLATPLAFAAPAYGTRMPKKKEAFWGVEHYYVKRRNLDNDLGSLSSHQNHLLLSYGLTEWFSLDLKLSLYSKFRNNPTGGDQMEYEDPVWGGGYGFRIRLYESGPWKMTTGFQHISIHPKTVKANGAKQSGILDDWQYSALASYDLKRLTPYAGVQYAMMDYIHTINEDDRNRIRSDDDRRFGLVVGVDVPVGERAWINLETDWQDGGSATAGVHFRF